MLTARHSAPPKGRVLNPVQVALAAAAAELRIARRTVRTWVFAGLAIAVGLVVYHTWSIQHTQVGIAAHPRFALPGFGILVLWVLAAGTVLLAFDIPGRDTRERVAAALDSRPPSNIALLAGRLLAVALASWLPLLLLAVLLQGGGFVIDHLDTRAGVAAEPVSLATFMFIDVPATLLFWGALVVLLAATLHNRLVVAVVALGLLAIHVLAVLNTPLYLLPIVSGVANLGLPGSEILPRTVSGTDLVSVDSLPNPLRRDCPTRCGSNSNSSRSKVVHTGFPRLRGGGATWGRTLQVRPATVRSPPTTYSSPWPPLWDLNVARWHPRTGSKSVSHPA